MAIIARSRGGPGRGSALVAWARWSTHVLGVPHRGEADAIRLIRRTEIRVNLEISI
jgi:hypothetical protein